ncbi:MAG: hypothetical protein JWN73_2613 [Betaproteobacteria bacterium]|nr:hypothetical protein [Betaproteobacteria bacterium]
MRGRLALALLVAVALLGWNAYNFFLDAGSYLEGPARAPIASDLIVSLGGDGGQRAQKAADLYRAGFGPHVLLTGMETLPGSHYAEWRVHLLRDRGVPGRALMFDSSASNSWEEAVRTLEVMREHGWERVLVVSDPPHLRRLQWTWDKVFEGSGKKFVLVASNMQNWDADAWWREDNSKHFVASEYLKLAYYIATKKIERKVGPT